MPLFTGSNSPETIAGSVLDDTILGQGGNDSLTGNAGNDFIDGDEGDDTLRGGLGNDTLTGGPGNDSLFGNENDDTLIMASGNGNDTYFGGSGVDTLVFTGGWLADLDTGTGQDDFFAPLTTITFQAIERLQGSVSNDTFYGSSGNDTLEGGGGLDYLDGRDGHDVLIANRAIWPPDAGIPENGTLLGGDGNDTLHGNGAFGEQLTGGAGDDVFVFDDARGYGSSVVGGEGFDVLQLDFSAAAPSLSLALQTIFEIEEIRFNTLAPGASTALLSLTEPMQWPVTVRGATTPGTTENLILSMANTGTLWRIGLTDTPGVLYTLDNWTFADWGSEDRLTIVGTDGGDDLTGSALNETIDGFGGADTLRGGDGNDRIVGFVRGEGGAGNDTLVSGPGSDAVTIDGGSGTDTIDLLGGGTYSSYHIQGGGAGEQDALRFTGLSGGTGFDLRGAFLGGLSEMVFATSDTGLVLLDGRNLDPVSFALGIGKWVFGNQTETVEFRLDESNTNQNIDLSRVRDIVGKSAADTIRILGTSQANRLTGTFEADEITGGTGAADTLSGNAGNDTLTGAGLLEGGADDDLLTAVVSALVDVSTLNGDAGADTLVGSSRSDLLDGGDGDDLLQGRDGVDTLRGGAGSDTLSGGGDDDVADFSDLGPPGTPPPNSGMVIDLVQGSATLIVGATLIDTDQLNSIEDIIGSGWDDIVIGSAQGNEITGGGGDDTIDGRDGDDLAAWAGPVSDYALRIGADGALRVEDRRTADGDEGTDHVTDVETLRFGATTLGAADLVQQAFFAETGSVDLTDAVTTVMLRRSYDTPVVVSYVATTNGIQPVAVRVTELAGNRLGLRLQEPNTLDGAHITETVHYLVAEAGTWVLPDGTLFEAGLLDTDLLTTAGFAPVAFDAEFDSAPVVLSQVQTEFGPDFVTTRQRNTDTDGTEIALQEEEALNGGSHVSETVGWIAIGPGDGAAAGLSWHAGETTGVTDADTALPRGAAAGPAALTLAQLASFAGSDPAWARGNGVSGNGPLVSVEEDTSLDAETTHVAETISHLTFGETGLLPALMRQTVMETGRLDLTDAEQTITLSHDFAAPVVLAFVTTTNGVDPVTARVISAAGNSLTLRLQEPNNLDGTHVVESVTYLVAEAGRWMLPDGTLFEAGTMQSSRLTPQGFDSVGFSAGFDAAPVVLSQVQTFNGSDFVVTRQTGVTASGLSVALQEEEALNSGTHATETIGWIAIEAGSGSVDGLRWLSAQGSAITDADTLLSFGTDLGPHALAVAGVSSFAGADTGWTRGAGVSGTGFTVSVEEDTSLDAETGHVGETVGFIAVSGAGTLSGYDLDLLF